MTQPTATGRREVPLEEPLRPDSGISGASNIVRRRRRSGRGAYFLRRVGSYLVVIWAAVTLNFIIPRFMPGDPAEAVLRRIRQTTGEPPTPSQIESVQRLYGDPTENLLQQYLAYWGSVFRFDFGISTAHYPTPVSEIVLQALPWTLFLIGVSTVVAWIIGTVLGAIMGWRPGSRFDSWFAPLSTFFHAFPGFWIALVLLWILSIQFEIFPVAGGYDASVPMQINNVYFLASVFFFGALPMGALIFIGFNGWLFSMRNVMVATVTEDYVLMARAKGLPERKVLFSYAARNALLPNVTGLAMAIGGVIAGAVLIEAVFTYPGMGYLLQTSITGHDFPVMQTVLLMLTFTSILANFIADSIYVLLDPRAAETN